MKIKTNGQFGTYILRLGIQTNINDIGKAVKSKILAWKPKKAKSFRISRYQNTDYNGFPMMSRTGYASFDVTYYTTKYPNS